MEAVTDLIQSSQSKRLFFFEYSRVSSGAYPLTKKAEDSEYEIGNAFDDLELDPRLSPLCQVGDDVIRSCISCGGCKIRVPRSIHSINVVPYVLDTNLYQECVLSTTNAITLCLCVQFYINCFVRSFSYLSSSGSGPLRQGSN